MKAKKKSFRKEMKQPDEFESFWQKVVETVVARKRDFLLGLSGVVLILVLVFAVRSHFQNRDARASGLLAQAQSLLSFFPSAEQSPSGPKAAQSAEPSPEDKEKAQGILEHLIEDFGGTHAAQLGRILVGNLYYDQGLYDKSAQAYEDFLGGRKEPAALEDMALQGLGYSQEAKGDYEKALGAYEKLAKSKRGYIQAWAWLGIARCHELLGQPEKALEAYRKILADYPYHPDVEEVKASISRLSQATKPDKPSTPGPGGNEKKSGT